MRSRRAGVALGQERELSAEQQLRRVERADVGPQDAPAYVQRTIERRFSPPPPVKAAMAARQAPRDQRESVDPGPQLDRAEPGLLEQGERSRPACSSTCSASDTSRAGTSNRRTTRPVRAPGAPRREAALDGARARAPACSTRARRRRRQKASTPRRRSRTARRFASGIAPPASLERRCPPTRRLDRGRERRRPSCRCRSPGRAPATAVPPGVRSPVRCNGQRAFGEHDPAARHRRAAP